MKLSPKESHMKIFFKFGEIFVVLSCCYDIFYIFVTCLCLCVHVRVAVFIGCAKESFDSIFGKFYERINYNFLC